MKNIARLIGDVKKLQREKTRICPNEPFNLAQVLNGVIARR